MCRYTGFIGGFMKFMHLADLHIGKNVNSYELIEDQSYILDEILNISDSNNINVIVISGDIYDKKQPSEKAVSLFDNFLTKCSTKGKTVIAISGNHDSDERLNFGSRIFSNNNLYITGLYSGEVPFVELEDEYGPIYFHMLPFIKASLVKSYYPEEFENEETNSYQKAVDVALKHPGLDYKTRNVLLAHQFVAGSTDPLLSDSEDATADVGTVEKIGTNIFDAFDYVALGHIHIPQQVGRESIRYSGSPLCYSASEITREKSVPIVEIKEKGDVSIELVPLKPLRKMRKIKGELSNLISAARALDPHERSDEFGKNGPLEDYIFATLTDEDEVPNSYDKLKDIYPRLMSLTFENSRTKALAKAEISDISTDKSFVDLMSDFYKQILGNEIDDEDLACLKEVAKEAGIINETD